MTGTDIARKIKITYRSNRKFCKIEDIAQCPQDPESFEECSIFMGKGWADVKFSEWSKHHYAISFFTQKARRLFWPSVMLNTVEHPDETYLAFKSYMYHFEMCDSHGEIVKIIGKAESKSICFKQWLIYVSSNLPQDFLFESKLLRDFIKK